MSPPPPLICAPGEVIASMKGQERWSNALLERKLTRKRRTIAIDELQSIMRLRGIGRTKSRRLKPDLTVQQDLATLDMFLT
jgi:hypothetical protein